MSFFKSNAKMQSQLVSLIDQFARDGRPGLQNSISITWIRYPQPNPEPCSGVGASWHAEKLIYPASVVKLFYAIAIEEWLQQDLLIDSQEIREALKDMIANSSNDATSLLIDLLTGTTSGPSISGEKWSRWKEQRNLVNNWLHSLEWPEVQNINCCQKTWSDGPYGREKEFYGHGRKNQNTLSTLGTARILEAVMTNNIISPLACKRLQKILSRTLDIQQRSVDPENQVDGFIGEGLIHGTKLWSKAGLMSTARHDATWSSTRKGNPMLLIIFCQGQQLAKDKNLLPAIAQTLQSMHLKDQLKDSLK